MANSVAETFTMPDCAICLDKGEMHYLLGKQGECPKRKAEYEMVWFETSNTLDQIRKVEFVCGPCSEDTARKYGGTRTRIGLFEEEFRGKLIQNPAIGRTKLTGYGQYRDGKMWPNTDPHTEEFWKRETETWSRTITLREGDPLPCHA